jgi:hypothetical protein
VVVKTLVAENLSKRHPDPVPVGLKLAYGFATPVIAAVYARSYGPKNFLWLSDIALGLTTAAVLTETGLPASMAAVGALPLEIAWNADVLAGGRLMGLAAYMFDRQLPLGLRALSLFHAALPPTLIWLLRNFGYDRRALPLHCGLSWLLLPLTYALTRPEDNVNWVFGPGTEPQTRLPPRLYLALAMIAWPLLVHWPTHLVLRRLFSPGSRLPGAAEAALRPAAQQSTNPGTGRSDRKRRRRGTDRVAV